MKKIISMVLIAVMVLSCGIFAGAEDTYTVTPSGRFSVLVNGRSISSERQVTASDKIKLSVSDSNVVAVLSEGMYYDVNKTFTLSADADFTNAEMLTSGLAMVSGAQVRVGDVELTDGKIDATKDSGLRFIATADYNSSVIADSEVEFGIKVVAEGSENYAYIKADKFQNEDCSVFSAAITKLAASNYNRKYTACAYAKIPLHDNTIKEVTTDSVTRSIYQVSVGILKNSSAEADDNLPYTIDEAVKSVLNAYINQTGIRLTYYKDGTMVPRITGSGSYTGDLFFSVESNSDENGVTEVVITPLGEADGFGNEVELQSWWKEYIRINNNNTIASNYISDVKLENNTLSFKFSLPNAAEYTFDQEDNVTIVTSIGNGKISGIKAGQAVEYTMGESVYIMGLATELEEIVPGCVVLIAEEDGECEAIELLASLGMPINPDTFEADFGVYDAADGTTKYKNVVTEMFSKNSTKIVCRNLPDTTKVTYNFESGQSMCYRVGIAMENNVPVVTANGSKISTYPSIFEDTSKYHNYLYLRYNSETEKVKECVFYCVPKDLDFSNDDEYSNIFSLDNYRVIIE